GQRVRAGRRCAATQALCGHLWGRALGSARDPGADHRQVRFSDGLARGPLDDPEQPRLRVIRLPRPARAGDGTLVADAGDTWRSRYLGLRSGCCRSHPWSSRRVIPTVTFSSLRNARWWQFAVRFVLGGAVTACTGLVAQHWGPIIGGLFLSFPA